MNIFDHTVNQWINERLVSWGLAVDVADKLDGFIVLIYVLVLILLINILFRWGVMRGVHWVTLRTKASWDNVLFDQKVMKHLCDIITPVVLSMMLPLAISALGIKATWITTLLVRVVQIAIVITSLRFISTFFEATFKLIVNRPAWHGKPIKGLLQIVQVLLALIGIILVIAIILNISPAGLLTGLGASAAVISFIFKDTLLGLVAGIQLAANDMLKVGDWIEMPSRGVDGTVVEVSLTTIKIRCWDNTLLTIPPYLLISEPFDNWQAMRDAGGRRVKRSLNVDMTSVHFASEEFVERLRNERSLAPLVERMSMQSAEGGVLTNLDLYMRAITEYLNTHPRVHHGMMVMVRQLQPTEWGLPMELYFFSSDVNWVPYEHLQTEVISHIIALAPLFDVRLYQAPSSHSLTHKFKNSAGA
ncbi:MAG: mechanosensitive ion channel [Alistipes sp.]|nr:mechanosensitive ion channel [Alistipes sp.]